MEEVYVVSDEDQSDSLGQKHGDENGIHKMLGLQWNYVFLFNIGELYQQLTISLIYLQEVPLCLNENKILSGLRDLNGSTNN